MPDSTLRVPLPRRLLALSGYLGLAPWLGIFRAFRQDPFLRHHRAQAMILHLWLAPFLLLELAGLLALTDILTEESWLFDFDLVDVTFSAIFGFNVALGVVAAGWVLIWLVAVGLAFAGSVRRAPYVRGERSPWVQRLEIAWSGFLGLAVLLLVAFGLYSSRLARSSGGPAPVYLLFDPRGYEALGNWGPKMAFYRVAREATERWGEGSAVVAPLSRQSFGQALRHGRFVVLLVHGTEGIIASSALRIEPPDRAHKGLRFLHLRNLRTEESEDVTPGADLQLLYISGCRTGIRGNGGRWQQALAPTEVITFDRFTGGLEHLWWLWTEAPHRLRTIR